MCKTHLLLVLGSTSQNVGRAFKGTTLVCQAPNCLPWCVFGSTLLVDRRLIKRMFCYRSNARKTRQADVKSDWQEMTWTWKVLSTLTTYKQKCSAKVLRMRLSHPTGRTSCRLQAFSFRSPLEAWLKKTTSTVPSPVFSLLFSLGLIQFSFLLYAPPVVECCPYSVLGFHSVSSRSWPRSSVGRYTHKVKGKTYAR